MTTMKLETPRSVIWKKSGNKIREGTETKLFLVCYAATCYHLTIFLIGGQLKGVFV